jgi:glutathione synthase/RimK-type ligase-like ATP-grasp enzyme
MERLERAGNLTVGTPAEIRAAFDKIAAAANPEFMSLNVPQGFVPFEDTVKYLRVLGEQIMPHYL